MDPQSVSNEKAGDELCFSCVYFPPNLPTHAYSADDYAMLQQLNCSFEFSPGQPACHNTRKTSCSLVDLENIPKSKDK